MLTKVVCSGQTGVEQAAIRAAKAHGLDTGGWAPFDYNTEDGPASWLGCYGLVECYTSSQSPVMRTVATCSLEELTIANLAMADFVLVIDSLSAPCRDHVTKLVIDITQRDLGNGGARSEPLREIVEMGACALVTDKTGRSVNPTGWYGIRRKSLSGGKEYVSWFRPRYVYQTPAWVASRIKLANVTTLMVTGNRESVNPGIGLAAEEFIGEVLDLLLSA